MSVTVPPGEYNVSGDIPEGSYRVVCTGGLGFVTIWDSKGNLRTMHTLTTGDEVGKLQLRKGDVVEISGYNMIFQPFLGFNFGN